jgi:hypothetical protein
MESKTKITVRMRLIHRIIYLLTDKLVLWIDIEDAKIVAVPAIQVGRYKHTKPTTTVIKDYDSQTPV